MFNVVFVKNATVMSCVVLYLYDYLCTLDREVQYIWTRPWTFGSFLFVLNRYLPIPTLVLSVGVLRFPKLSVDTCNGMYSAVCWLTLVIISTSQIIIYLRTIAIWERNRIVMGIIASIYTASMIVSGVTIHLYIESMRFVPWPYGGCLVTSISSIVRVSYCMVLLSETTIVILTVIRAVTHLRNTNSSWVHTLYRQGFLFYIYLLAVTLLNIIFPVFATPVVRTLFTDLQRVLHSIVCSRIIFFIHSKQELSEIADSRIQTGVTRWAPEYTVALSTVLDTYATRDYDDDEGYNSYSGYDTDHTTRRIQRPYFDSRPRSAESILPSLRTRS